MEDLRSVTRYDRRDHGRGVVSWVYDYWNVEPISHSGLASGLELGVQVRGDWTHAGARGRDVYRKGQAHHLSIGERFETTFDGRAEPGTQVGFAIYPHEDEAHGARLSDDLCFANASPEVDARFLTFCRELDAQRDLPSSQIADEVWSYLDRRCELVAKDPVATAKEELERYFDRELRIEHIAEVAGLNPVTFARKFKARYGITPVSYRVRWRFHHAARLLWSRLDLSIKDVAQTCALGDLPYFYRGFNKLFRSTPGTYRERALILLGG